MSTAKFWIAFAVGVTAGAAVALLYAPQTGGETRDQLMKKMDEAGNYVGDAGAYLKDTAGKLGAQAENVIRSTKGSVNDIVETVVQRASGAASAVSKAV